MVRRALGGVSNGQNTFGPSTSTISSSYYDDLSCSLSSCQSNLDNIKPPTIMDDQRFMDQMDNSILSIASISSEIAPLDMMEKSTGSGKLSAFEVIHYNDESNVTNNNNNKEITSHSIEPVTNVCEEEPISDACCTALEDIAPPTLMEDVSGCTKTLVEETLRNVQRSRDGRDSDQTYTIQGNIFCIFRYTSTYIMF